VKAVATEKLQNVKTSKTAPSNKSYMKFDFYFKRTLFRTMTEFYKFSFKEHYEAFKTQKDTNYPIEKFLVEWVQETQPGLLE
jgi:hypothetical protein